MKTPLFDFVSDYLQRDVSRFHMPGHKGKSFLGCEARDITEIEGADVLYAPDGIIAQSEDNATSLFGTGHTFYSAEGSSLSIKAMLTLAVSKVKGKRRPHVLAARNAHKAFLYAVALLDADVTWIYPKSVQHLCSCTLSASDVEDALQKADTLPDAVYLTSPDYLGQSSDIGGIARVCHANGIPLLVDNAHGAYLAFLSQNTHPIALGADMCCDSAHKTLPVLTGGAYLHLSQNALQAYGMDAVRSALSLFASTSPSYLILQSLDLCNRYLSDGYRERLASCIARTEVLKEHLAEQGYEAENAEPLKLVLHAKKYGTTGTALSAYLRERLIEVEYADSDMLVLMLTPELREQDFERLENAFASLPKSTLVRPTPFFFQNSPCETVMTPTQALFSKKESVPVEQSLGRICASPTVSCPPAIPVVISGERIDARALELLLHYGIKTVEVVADP